jgi:hypothetical protein
VTVRDKKSRAVEVLSFLLDGGARRRDAVETV